MSLNQKQAETQLRAELKGETGKNFTIVDIYELKQPFISESIGGIIIVFPYFSKTMLENTLKLLEELKVKVITWGFSANLDCDIILELHISDFGYLFRSL